MKKGIVCISFDVELLWGRHDINYQDFSERVKKERYVVKQLLTILKKYTVSATWAFIGHVMLDTCKKKHGFTHPEVTRGKFPWVSGDWFQLDPGTNIKEDPAWYGLDIFEQVKKYKNQDIGSHSFSHVQFGQKGCTKACAESEVKLCVEIAKKQGIRMRSFVFPYNSVGHLDVIKKYGFTVFRGKDQYTDLNRLDRLKRIVELFIPSDVPVHIPKKKHGLINIPGSYYFVSARGFRKIIPQGIRARNAKRGIDTAITKKAVFHMWTHPIDLTDNPKKLLDEFEDIVKYAAQKRDEGKIEILNMKQIADRVI